MTSPALCHPCHHLRLLWHLWVTCPLSARARVTICIKVAPNKPMCRAERFSAKLNPKAWTEIPRLLYHICNKDIGMEFHIGNFVMLMIRRVKRHMTEGIELPNQEKIRMLGGKELRIFGDVGSGHPQTSGNERKNSKRYLRRRGNYLKINYIAGISKGFTLMLTPL